jgi:hypothetical protein
MVMAVAALTVDVEMGTLPITAGSGTKPVAVKA